MPQRSRFHKIFSVRSYNRSLGPLRLLYSRLHRRRRHPRISRPSSELHRIPTPPRSDSPPYVRLSRAANPGSMAISAGRSAQIRHRYVQKEPPTATSGSRRRRWGHTVKCRVIQHPLQHSEPTRRMSKLVSPGGRVVPLVAADVH